jgi:hypothetical protein
MKKGFPYIVIAILFFIIIWLTKCSGETIVTGVDTLTKVSYVHYTIKVKCKTKIKPVPVIRWIHDTIIDSTGNITIVNHKKYTTNDTFEYKTDSFTAIFYTKIYSQSPIDSINNSLLSSIRHKIIETTITKQVVRKYALFAGPSVGLNLTHISLDGLYEREGKIIYRAGIGVNNQFQPMLSAGIYWQFSR